MLRERPRREFVVGEGQSHKSLLLKRTESREFSVSIYNVRARRACTISASWLVSVLDSADRWRLRGRKELSAGPSDVPHGLPRYSYRTFVH